jgi:LAO/AO transport system kinase
MAWSWSWATTSRATSSAVDRRRDSELERRIVAGDIRALARAITLVERRDPSIRAVQAALSQLGRSPQVVGFTGAPGTGKSTLVDALVTLLRKQERSVAVVATDPNSPFTGGAILGDRIRMQRHALDPKVFIRSMGARGHLGGLSLAAREAVRLLGAFGFDPVILETVGVGQSELEIAEVADTTVVVLTPNLGDGVQMIKAGILEIADVFVVNKSDLEGHDRVVMELRAMLSLTSPSMRRSAPAAKRPRPGGGSPAGMTSLAEPNPWKPPIVKTVAARQEGIDELWAAIEAHRKYLEASGRGRELAESRLQDETAEVVAEAAREQALALLAEDPRLAGKLRKDGTPYLAAQEILSRMRKGPQKRNSLS